VSIWSPRLGGSDGPAGSQPRAVGQSPARWGRIAPRTAVAEGFKVSEQELGMISSETMAQISEWSTFRGVGEADEPGLWYSSREGPDAPRRGKILPRTAAGDGFRVKDQNYSAGTLLR
jgi:hypothetical protein